VDVAMYDRFTDIERISKAVKMLEQLNGEYACYGGVCQTVRQELEKAISYETGIHPDMTRYSTFTSNDL
jgi:hypothetical protein